MMLLSFRGEILDVAHTPPGLFYLNAASFTGQLPRLLWRLLPHVLFRLSYVYLSGIQLTCMWWLTAVNFPVSLPAVNLNLVSSIQL